VNLEQSPEVRMSDADRDKVAERLRAAFGEGRLTPEEFEHRLNAVLTARVFSEIEPFIADLPGSPQVREFAELKATAATLKRKGRWAVPRRIRLLAKAGSAKLDFTEATIPHRIVDIELDVFAGTTVLVLPLGSTVDYENVEFIAGNPAVSRAVAISHVPGDGPHFVVHGKHRAGRLVVRHQRHFLHWRW
jgi:hypothetical protein